MARSKEIFWWSLFSAGGVVSALFIPILVILTGLIWPFLRPEQYAISYRRLLHAVSFWPVKIILFAVLSLTFFHCAHRIRHVVTTIGLEPPPGLLAVVCYGAAFAGTVATVVALIRV